MKHCKRRAANGCKPRINCGAARPYLAEAQRLTHTGSFGWSVQSGEIRWSDETFRIFECDPENKTHARSHLARTHQEDIAFVKQTIERASREQKGF